MADGRLGAVDVSAATVTIIFTSAANKVTTCNIGLCNRDSANTPKVRLGVMDSDNIADIANEDWYLEYDTDLLYGIPIGHSMVVVAAGHSVVVYSDLANISAGSHGFEQNA